MIQAMSGNLTYKQSGVDTIEAQSFVSDISAHVKRTQKNRQLCNAFGLFAAAYAWYWHDTGLALLCTSLGE